MGRMEMKKIPEAGYSIEGLNISGIQRRLTLKNLLFPFKLISSIVNAFAILKRERPDVVIGVGGYASSAVLYAANKKKIPTLIQEQNSFAGLTNKWLASGVKKICVAYSGMEKFFPASKIVVTGNPVRSDILSLEHKRNEGLKYYGLKEDKPVILVTGGSLGARNLNDVMLKDMQRYIDADCQVIWQTGSFYHKEIMNKTKSVKQEHIKVVEFIKAMDLAYAASDVVVCRSGALTVAELSLAVKSSVFVPSPNVAEDHQTKNAMALVSEDAAILVKDIEARDKLTDVTLDLVKDSSRRGQLEKNIAVFGRPNAAKDIVNEIFKLIPDQAI